MSTVISIGHAPDRVRGRLGGDGTCLHEDLELHGFLVLCMDCGAESVDDDYIHELEARADALADR